MNTMDRLRRDVIDMGVAHEWLRANRIKCIIDSGRYHAWVNFYGLEHVQFAGVSHSDLNSACLEMAAQLLIEPPNFYEGL